MHDRVVADVVGSLAGLTRALSAERARVLVAIDGPDAAGKTTLAAALAERLRDGRGSPPHRLLQERPMQVLHVSADDFHRPRPQRYQRLQAPAEGYYRDSFDTAALTACCLQPFRRGAVCGG